MARPAGPLAEAPCPNALHEVMSPGARNAMSVPNEDPAPQQAQEPPASPRRQHRILATILIVVAALMLFISSWATLVSRGILNAQNWGDTSKELLQDEEIRTAVATYLTDQLFTPDQVQQRLAETLPPALAGLAGPASVALQQAALKATNRVLESPKFQDLWANANEAAMAAAIRLVEDKGKFVSLEGNAVVLDLHAVLTAASERIGLGGRLIEQVPADKGQIVLMRSDQLGFFRGLVHVLKFLSFWFFIGAALLFGLAVYLARGWRREAVRNGAVAIAVAGLLVLVLRRFIGHSVIDSLVANGVYKTAALNTWAIATAALRSAAWAGIVFGLIGVLVTSLLGSAKWAVSSRRWLAPQLSAHAWAGYAVAVIVALLFLLWAPTQRASWIPAIIILALLATAVGVLRRQCAQEFPQPDAG